MSRPHASGIASPVDVADHEALGLDGELRDHRRRGEVAGRRRPSRSAAGRFERAQIGEAIAVDIGESNARPVRVMPAGRGVADGGCDTPGRRGVAAAQLGGAGGRPRCRDSADA